MFTAHPVLGRKARSDIKQQVAEGVRLKYKTRTHTHTHTHTNTHLHRTHAHTHTRTHMNINPFHFRPGSITQWHGSRVSSSVFALIKSHPHCFKTSSSFSKDISPTMRKDSCLCLQKSVSCMWRAWGTGGRARAMQAQR